MIKKDINQQKQNRTSGINKTKIEPLVLFNLNLGSSSTEMDFIQKKVKKIILKKGHDGNIFNKTRITWPKIAQET